MFLLAFLLLGVTSASELRIISSDGVLGPAPCALTCVGTTKRVGLSKKTQKFRSFAKLLCITHEFENLLRLNIQLPTPRASRTGWEVMAVFS